MIDALIQGRLHGTPTQRTGASGKPFAVAKVRTPTANGESIFVSVIAFAPAAQAALLALGDGDAVALAGELTPKVWAAANGEHKPACDLLAHQVLTPYHVQRRREVVTRKREAVARKPDTGRPKDEAWQAGAAESLDF